MVFAAGSEGGVRHDEDKKCDKAAFLYLSHSAVVINFESALTLQTRENEKDESDPPQTRGVMRSQKEMRFGIPFLARMTGRSRPHLSLREGSETAAMSGAESTETEL